MLAKYLYCKIRHHRKECYFILFYNLLSGTEIMV